MFGAFYFDRSLSDFLYAILYVEISLSSLNFILVISFSSIHLLDWWCHALDGSSCIQANGRTNRRGKLQFYLRKSLIFSMLFSSTRQHSISTAGWYGLFRGLIPSAILLEYQRQIDLFTCTEGCHCQGSLRPQWFLTSHLVLRRARHFTWSSESQKPSSVHLVICTP